MGVGCTRDLSPIFSCCSPIQDKSPISPACPSDLGVWRSLIVFPVFSRMGRNKIEIEKLQTALARQTTFSKRKSGLVKKVKDLSILCDVEIALLMFSPGGRPTLQLKENSDLGEILAKFEGISLPEREGRKRETLERLKKMMRKINHDVDTKELIHDSSDSNQRILELGSKLQQLKAELAETSHKLSIWAVPESVDDLDQIKRMEETLIKSLNQLHEQQAHLAGASTSGTLAAPEEYLEDSPALFSPEDQSHQIPSPSNFF